jgi:rhamnosyltransferase
MKVDIIIPTYKPDDTFCLLLHKLQGQTFVVHRVIIINTEEALWNEALEKYQIEKALSALPFGYEICHIKQSEFDHAATRRMGVEMSDADVIIFMTQDAVPADKYMVEKLVEALKIHNDIAVAYARQLPAKDCGVIERYTRQFNYPKESRVKTERDIKSLGIKTFFCSDVCAAYVKKIYDKLGGFEAPAIFNEDMIFAARAIEAGYGVAYAAEARVVHSHNYTAGQQFKRNFDLAVSQADHSEIFGAISSESEGIALVKKTCGYLVRIGKPYLIAKLFVQSAAKYAGYFMGKRYKKLSRRQILRYTMNKSYWSRVWKED